MRPSPQSAFDTGLERTQIREQLKKLLSAWALRSKTDLESAEWHYHFRSDEDVLIVITRHDVCFRVIVQPMDLSNTELKRRKAELLKKA